MEPMVLFYQAYITQAPENLYFRVAQSNPEEFSTEDFLDWLMW